MIQYILTNYNITRKILFQLHSNIGSVYYNQCFYGNNIFYSINYYARNNVRYLYIIIKKTAMKNVF